MQYTEFIIYILVFVRVISFLGVSPIFMIKGVPNITKIGFGLILSLLVFNFVDYNAALLPSSVTGLILIAASECLFGLMLGYITTLVIYAIRMSGQFMDLQIGFSMSSFYDPMTSSTVTLMGNLTYLAGVLIFILIDGHHMLIQAIIQSFNIVPLLEVKIPSSAGSEVLTLFVRIVVLSLKLAAPIVIVLFITEFTMGLIARTVPQLNILMLGMPVKVLVGLLAFSAIFPALIQLYVKAFEGMPKDIDNYLKLFPLMIFFASGEKTEEATPKKKEDARKKGQVAKSRELTSAITLAGIVLLMAALGNSSLEILMGYINRSLTRLSKGYMGEGDVESIFIYSISQFMKVTLPVFAGVMAFGIIANLIQTGFINSLEPLKPKFERLNPLEGFKRMFSGRAYMEFFKAVLNILIVGYAVFGFVKGELFTILKTSDMGINALYNVPRGIIQSELVRVAIIIAALGILDFMYQKYSYNKELRMTKQEIKEEYKQMEGDPQIKSKIKQRQREMAQRRMMQEVPKATVVVTNPTHFAVALRYESGKYNAPLVVAKGADEIAMRIKKIAQENNVPIVENKPAARMLYERAELGEEVPLDMYQVVAEILAFVYSLKKKGLR